MEITITNRKGKDPMVLQHQSIARAKEALRIGQAFNIPVTIRADGNDFSRLCSALMLTMQDLQECIDDVAAFHAPRECINLVVHDSQRQVHRLLEDFGFTPETFLAELDQRVSQKFVYQWNGFGVITTN